MATSHPQAYFRSDELLAASESLDPALLRSALPSADGLRVSEVEGLGLVAARRVGEFTHLVAGVTTAIEVSGFEAEPGALDGEIERHEVDLAFLADAPAGVATRLLDAALSGPVIFTEPDEQRRADWIAWLTYALPTGANLTFTTCGPEDGVRVNACAEADDAIDASQPSDLPPSLYARIALTLADRGALREAVAHLKEPDGVALAVRGGATDLITPDHLPHALELITELVASGHVREAARAAAALPVAGAVPGTGLEVHEPVLLPEVLEPELEEIPEAEVVEDEPEPADEVAEMPELEPIPDDTVIVVPFEADIEAEPEIPHDAAFGDDVVISVPFDVDVDAAEEEDPLDEDDLPDVDAWSSLLGQLKSDGVEPDKSIPPLPTIDELRLRDRYFSAPAPESAPPQPPGPGEPFEDDVVVSVPFEPADEPEPPPAEPLTFEMGASLDAFAALLGSAPAPAADQVLEEEELGMSLAELEASLKKDQGS